MAAEIKKENGVQPESRRLDIAMLKHINRVYELLKPNMVDISFLKPYQQLVPESAVLDLSNLVELGSKFLYALDLCKDASVVAGALVAVGSARVDQEYARSRLTRAPQHFAAASIKSTESMVDAFVDQDALYIAERDTLNQWKAVSHFFDKTRQSFENWHNWIKKLYDGENQALPDVRKMRGA